MKTKVIFRNRLAFIIGVLIWVMLFPLRTLAIEADDIEQLKRELHKTSGQEKLQVLSDIVAYYAKISYDETATFLAQYLALAEETSSLTDLAQAYVYSSTIALNQIEHHKAVCYTRKALKLYETLGDSLNICCQYVKLSHAYVCLREPDSALQAIDPALKYFSKHEHGLNLYNTKIQLGKSYYIADQYIAARDILQEVVSDARKTDSYAHLAWASYCLGSAKVRLGNFQEAILNFSEDIKTNDSLKNVAGKLGGMQELGDAYLKIGEFANAYQLYFDCYQQKDVVKGYHGELQFTAEYHTNLGKIYHNTQRYQEAIDQYDTAMRLIDQFDFSPTRGIIHNMIGQTRLSMNDPKRALWHFEQSYHFYQEINSRYNTAFTQNLIAEVYMSLGKYDTAVTMLIQAFNTNQETHSQYGAALNLKNLAMCYFHEEKYTEAMDELDAGMPYVGKSGVDNLLLDYYSIYILLCNHAADCDRAKGYYDKFLPLSKMITSQHTKNLTELLLRSYTNELTTRTDLLNQTINLQKLEANHSALQFQRLFLFTVVIVLILLIIGILFFFNLKTAKKLQRLVEERTSTIRLHEQKLIEMSKAKDKMYSIIAHDLKSPFNSLMGFSSLLNDEYDDFSEKEKRKFIHFIHHSSEELFALLENLLEWARNSSDGIKYKPVMNDINLIVEHTIQLQEKNAGEKKIALNNYIPEGTFVFADENMLRTIIRNLTSNAIKFTNAGGSISYLSQEFDSMVRCTVQDTGTGIAPEDIKNLFDADSKIRKKGTANEGGTGLGLLLVKEFVEKNKGKLFVESQPGEGSAFSFELPVG